MKLLTLLLLLPSAAAFVGTPSWSGARARTAAVATARARMAPTMGSFVTHFEELPVDTGRGVSMIDITTSIKDIVTKTGVKEGVVTIISKHSTCSIMLVGFSSS